MDLETLDDRVLDERPLGFDFEDFEDLVSVFDLVADLVAGLVADFVAGFVADFVAGFVEGLVAGLVTDLVAGLVDLTFVSVDDSIPAVAITF